MRVAATAEEGVFPTHLVVALRADSVGKIHLKDVATFRAWATAVRITDLLAVRVM